MEKPPVSWIRTAAIVVGAILGVLFILEAGNKDFAFSLPFEIDGGKLAAAVLEKIKDIVLSLISPERKSAFLRAF